MCLSPTTGRSSVGGGERCDDGDSNEGGSTSAINIGNGGGHCRDDGSGSGVVINITSVRIAPGNRTLPYSDDDGCTSTSTLRKTAIDNARYKQHDIRKLRKCLSTSVSNYETDGTGYNQQSSGYDYRNNTATTTQASLTSQSILTSVRQYSSFGSIFDKLKKKKFPNAISNSIYLCSNDGTIFIAIEHFCLYLYFMAFLWRGKGFGGCGAK